MDAIFSLLWGAIVVGIIVSVTQKKKRGNAQAEREMIPQVFSSAMPQQSVQRTVTDADRARLEEYRKKKAQGSYSATVPSQPNQRLDANRQRNASQPSIVERAKENSKRYAGEDLTLNEMESGHGHSERVSTAQAGYVEAEREAHRLMHENPMPPVEEAGCLGTVEDLMVKGYEGNLSFERDFIGEAQDFLASISMMK